MDGNCKLYRVGLNVLPLIYNKKEHKIVRFAFKLARRVVLALASGIVFATLYHLPTILLLQTNTTYLLQHKKSRHHVYSFFYANILLRLYSNTTIFCIVKMLPFC